MVNYNLGKIYKLVSHLTDKIYIGSTAEKYLSRRLESHRSDQRKYLAGEMNHITSYEMLQYPDVAIVLLESYPCATKDELLSRERFWIDNNLNICVNKVRPKITPEERRIYLKEYKKTMLGQSLQCACGGSYRRDGKARHVKYKKHISYINSLE
jgi:hypothetical protein